MIHKHFLLVVLLLVVVQLTTAQRIILSLNTTNTLPLVYTGYYTPDTSRNIFTWVPMELQGNQNPFHGELVIPMRSFDPIVYRAHIAGNTNFATTFYPFAFLSVSINPIAYNGSVILEGSAQCGDNVTGGGASSGVRFRGVAIDGSVENRCWNYNCVCGQCSGLVRVSMSVCLDPVTPKPSYYGRIKKN